MLESILYEAKKWKLRVQTLLAQGCKDKLTIVDLEELIAKGDKLAINSDEVDALKEHSIRHKSWMTKFENSGTITGSTTDLADLVAEGKSLLIDVSEQIDVINANTKAYCICRLHYHGDMIGCDSCDDWYHLSCVGVSSVQAENIENYLCIRCSIKNSFNESVVQCFKITNIWMDVASLSHDQKLKAGKQQKKLTSTQNSVRRMEAELKLISPAVGEVTPIAESNGSEASDPTVSRVSLLSNDILEANGKLEKVKIECEVLKVQHDFEIENYPVISKWMKRVQELLLPESSSSETGGRPVLSPGNLPPGFNDLVLEAKDDRFDSIDDVISAADHFRWMSWCYCCLYALRIPMTSNLLRFVLQSMKSIKSSDEKILKFLNGVSTRSTVWKARVRKLAGGGKDKKEKGDEGDKEQKIERGDSDGIEEISSSSLPSLLPPSQTDISEEGVGGKKRSRIVDASRVVYAFHDSALIPINSRLKPILKRGIDECHANLIDKGQSSAAESLIRFHQTKENPEGAPGKRGVKKAIQELVGVTVKLSIPEAFSSDEEDQLFSSGIVDEDEGDDSEKISLRFLSLIDYQKKMAASVAAAPDPYSIWPVDKSLFVLEKCKPKIDES